jgi:hypothetical protein
MKKIVHDTTDAFDQRLDVLQAAHAPQVEIDAAIVVYERLRTAQSICQALVPGAYSETAMISLLEAICNEAALRSGLDSDEDD